jgi:hypothetical protein
MRRLKSALLRCFLLHLHHQDQRQRGPKVFSLHAPEFDCIVRGKARAAYEFGCKVSVITPLTKPKSGQCVLPAEGLLGNPFDGPHTWPGDRRSRKAHWRYSSSHAISLAEECQNSGPSTLLSGKFGPS